MHKSCMNNYRASVYAGIKSDVEDFLLKFRNKNSLAYVDFASVWQLKSFTLIFADQRQLKSLEILCETCFFIIKKYIKSHSDLPIQVGAFYLLYGLYYKQPVEHLFKIRLTLEEFKSIKSLMERVKPKGHYDILYIYAKMLSEYAFKFVACPRLLGIIKYNYSIDQYDLFTTRTGEKLLTKIKDLFEDQTIKDLNQTCVDYDKKLQEFVKKNQTDMVAFESTFFQNLREENERIVSKFTGACESENDDTTTRARIRRKAMKNMNAQYRGEKQILTAASLEEKTTEDKTIAIDDVKMETAIDDVEMETSIIHHSDSSSVESKLPDLTSVEEKNKSD
ncbi:unnamed protein product [Ceutorhynchus assimilis]|uniref:snRNA-activating protein complex subunit 1 n=1 Tax=Ceutorhynchus assimilis TaxID=467358 RepID=A0A9N9QP65_9CUCU|nr:unnamed protein product [Ceutorhynchus assimilis]